MISALLFLLAILANPFVEVKPVLCIRHQTRTCLIYESDKLVYQQSLSLTSLPILIKINLTDEKINDHFARSLEVLLWDCGSGRELRALGFAHDVQHCAQLDKYEETGLSLECYLSLISYREKTIT